MILLRQTRLLLIAAAVAAILAACASTDSRIHDNQSTFDQLPPPVQQQIRAGQVGLGFTPQMVQMALGDPDRKFTRTSVEGDTEVWGYRDSGPAFSFGVGGGSFGSHGFGGGGVGVTTGGDDPDDKVRVVFANGVVQSVERNEAN
jgi:hypothetical protein